jgi:hypothetical protein
MASFSPELWSPELSLPSELWSSELCSSQSSSPEVSSSNDTLSNCSQSGKPDKSFRELNRLSIEEILDQDLRPTLVLDLNRDHGISHDIQPVFINVALRLHDLLLYNVTVATDDDIAIKRLGDTSTYVKFKNWATAIGSGTKNTPPEFYYHGVLWSRSTIRQRWRIISGNAIVQTSNVAVGNSQSAPSLESTTDRSSVRKVCMAAAIPKNTTSIEQVEIMSVNMKNDMRTKAAESSLHTLLSTPDDAVPDWTVLHPRGILSEYITFARAVDWANTPLGSMEKWSVQFRELANLTMVSTNQVRDASKTCH